MKVCPKCHMTVDHNDRCPICKESLVYEPVAHTDEETILWNNYYIRYLLKTLWFPVVCTIVSVACVISQYDTVKMFCLPIVLFNIISVFSGATQRRQLKWTTRMYTQEYQTFTKIFVKYLSGGLAVFLATIPLWL